MCASEFITPLDLDSSARFELDPDAGPTGVFDLADVDGEVPPEERGRVIAGRYEIIEHLGAGAMGQVLHVRHRRLGKSFALKLMQPDLVLDTEAIKLFVSEARLASALCHPNIVSVVDFGEDPDWGLFLAMELLEGESLAARIERGSRLPIERACTVVAQLASALAHSHDRQVVHGDVKPENVICVGDDADGWQVKLLDFGTAQLASHSAAIDEVVSGTPAYIAPERIMGSPPRPANDIYSLGALFYELLAGTPPFADDDPASVLQHHIRDQPDDVGARRGEVLDEQLVAIVHKALHKDPPARYASAAALHADIVAYLTELGGRERERAQRVGLADSSHSEAAADGFDALGIAAAGLDVDGTIRVVNPAFVQLLGAHTAADLEQRSVLSTALGSVHPAIREDLRLVAMTGKLVRRRVRIVQPDGAESVLRLLMTPASGRCGSCMLAVHPLARQ